jgi:FG-GAP-like repeat
MRGPGSEFPSSHLVSIERGSRRLAVVPLATRGPRLRHVVRGRRGSFGLNAKTILTADLDGNGQDEIVIDFANSGLWVYRNNSTWTLLHGLSPSHVAAGDIDGEGHKDLVIDFGAPFGLWTFRNNTTWAPLNPLSAEDIVVADRDGSGRDEVVIDFGPSYGLWEYANDSAWSLVHGQSPRSMVSGRFQ